MTNTDRRQDFLVSIRKSNNKKVIDSRRAQNLRQLSLEEIPNFGTRKNNVQHQ